MNQGKALREYIKESKFTQRELSKKLDMKENYFSMVLNKKVLNPDFIEKICAVLNATPEEIFIKKEDELKDKYKQLSKIHHELQKSCFDEKIQLVKQVQGLMTENHELKNDIHALKAELLKFKEK